MRRLAAIALLVPITVLAASGGPDDAGILFSSTSEPDGPPHGVLDLSAGTDLGLGADGTALVALPFSFDWGGTVWDTATVTADGALFFGDVPASISCPGTDGDWSGVAALWDDLGSGQVRTETFGRYPNRVFAVEWNSPHTGYSGNAQVQAWLTEGRDEAVISLDDLTFGDPAVDDGATAVVGVQAGAGTGLAWSCSGGLTAGESAWFGPEGTRPSAPVRTTGELAYALAGASSGDYAGRAVAAGEINGDGLADLVVGAQDADQVYVVTGKLGDSGGSLAYADMVVSGKTGEGLGSALAMGDLDGDGLDEVVIGAPTSSAAGAQSGAVYVLEGGGLPASLAMPADADLFLSGPGGSGKAHAGSALAVADLDGDGFGDLAVGAPRADDAATDAGATYLWRGSAAIAGSGNLTSSALTLTGEAAQDQSGAALAAQDMDGDGASELAVAAPYAAGSSGGTAVSHAGRVYLIPGGAESGTAALSSMATATVTGDDADDRLGISVALGDIDGDGVGDLAVGAPFQDGDAKDGGALYVFYGALSGDYAASDADAEVVGTSTAANVGQTVAIGDLSQDGQPDLVVGAPNGSAGASGGGLVGVFTDLLPGTHAITDADHLLEGDESAGAAGTALAVSGDHTGDGGPDLVVGVPYSSPTGTLGGGTVYVWSFVPDFWDQDGDGFVATESGGVDCDDNDPDIYPGRAEIADNGVDDDCDGWVDDAVIVRNVEAYWQWDLGAELGSPSPVTYGFEEATEGDDPADLYESEGILFSTGADLAVASDVWGSLPVDTLGVRIRPSSTANDVTMSFGEDIDALALQVLDGDTPFYMFATSHGVMVANEVQVSADGENRTGGAFLGFTFAQPVDTVRIAALTDDSWGFDALRVVWSADTDRDGDGFTDNEGDCDDDDAAINPTATEILGNGIDDDCDGVVDAGAMTLFTDEVSWTDAAAITPDWIDFEDGTDGEAIEEQYADRGIHFDGDISVTTDVDGSAPRDTLATVISGGSVTLTFDELQAALGLYVLDAGGNITVTGEVDGVTVYDVTVDMSGDDVDGGVFLGMIFDYGVDTLTLTSENAFDLWGLDDIGVTPIGQDDADGDGFTEAQGDCDDSDASVSPDATETWYDGVDENCDGASDYDADGDGFDDASAGGIDCDDSSSDINPDATETWYDGIDEDCDGLSDYDADKDGHDDVAYGGDDCDDGSSEVNPDATEVWYDGVDEDCSGTSDYDRDGDGSVPAAYADAVATDATVTVGDCDDGSDTTYPGATDTPYDGVDADCSGGSDDDADGDGHDAIFVGGDDCDDSDPDAYPGSTAEVCYDGADSNCDGADDWDCDGDGYELDRHGGTDCDDTDPNIHPGAPDPTHDGIDSNCDGALEYDDDGDGYDGVEDGGTDCNDDDPAINPGATEICYDGIDQNCDGAPEDDCDGDGAAADFLGGTDCNDEDGSIYPGAVDYPYDGVDQDCDGSDDFDIDGDGVEVIWYGGTDCDDSDASVYPGADDAWYDGVDSDCAGDDDYDADLDGFDAVSGGGQDCDDADPAVHPGATEIPLDGIDQDCDGVDDIDADGDGARSADDCNDADPSIFPGASEVCADGIDQDCDGADLVDCDGDGWEGVATGGSDCDDADPTVYPGATERWYDGTDQNCDGADDYDQDGDGHRSTLWGGDDCNDTDPTVNPDQAVDGCGGGDEDCDGAVDEDCAQTTDTGSDSGTDSGADSDSGSPAETGSPADTSTDTGTTGRSTWTTPKPGCGCASGGMGGSWALGLLAALALSRRRITRRA